MNKAEFLARLHKLLKKLPKEESQSAIRFYADYFNDAGEENEHRVLTELGSPEAVAKQILEDYEARGVFKPKKSMPKALLITLIVLASPLLAGVLGMAIGLAAVAFALAIAAFAVLFSFTIVSLALMLAGIVVVFAAFCVILQSPATCAFFAGLGLVAIGLGVLWAILTIYLTQKSVQGLRALFSKLRSIRKKEAIV